MTKGKNQEKGLRRRSQIKKAYFPLLFFFVFSFCFGRLFEIFAWNTNIIRIESVTQKAVSNQSSTCKYSQLNEQYWEEKIAEDAKIRVDFSPQYVTLNRKCDTNISNWKDQFDSYKPKFNLRFLINASNLHLGRSTKGPRSSLRFATLRLG